MGINLFQERNKTGSGISLFTLIFPIFYNRVVHSVRVASAYWMNSFPKIYIEEQRAICSLKYFFRNRIKLGEQYLQNLRLF